MTRHCVLLFVFLFPCVLSTPSNDIERELGRLFYNFNYKAGYRFENPLRQLREPCIVTLTEVLAGSRNDTPPELGCMLQGSDVVGDINDYEIRVDGVNSTYVEQLGLLSFESTLFAEGAVVDEGQKMVFMPWGTEIQVGKVESHERRLTSATGDKHVLALRVQGSGSAVSKSEAQISQSLFGFADSFNIDVKTQMEDCSDGKLRILKASDSANMPTTVKNAIGDDSVYTVTIDMDISAQSNLIDVVNKATEQFQTDFGVTLKSLAANPSNPDDLLVIFCIPPGTGNWQGFATRNGWKSWYNDEECTFLSVLMHEIGHNLNLAHSGKGDYSYGDYTGYMGETFSEVGLPLMCFNAPKTYQLNWFPDYHVDIDCQNTKVTKTTYDLIGFEDYGSPGISDKMILRLQNFNRTHDMYVSFNAANGINYDTGFVVANKVMITTREAGLDFGESREAGALSISDNTYSDQGVTITVEDISLFSSPARATVSVEYRPQAGQWVCDAAPQFNQFVLE